MAKKEEKMSHYQTIIAGGTAGALTRAFCQPLDVLKVRFQLQTEAIKSGSAKYTSMNQAIRLIIKEEGLLTMWSGHMPAQVLSITYSLTQFMTFEYLFATSEKIFPQACLNHRVCVNFLDGALAACSATLVSFPFDTARTRLIAEPKNNPVYKGLISALVTISQKEGIRALYQGAFPAMIMVMPQAGIQFAVYKVITENLPNLYIWSTPEDLKIQTANTGTFIIAGLVSGLVAKVTTYPFDLAKKRLQIQGFQEHRASFGKQIYCKGLRHCLQQTISTEGWVGLYKGVLPSIIKAMASTALQFTIYEKIKMFFLR